MCSSQAVLQTAELLLPICHRHSHPYPAWSQLTAKREVNLANRFTIYDLPPPARESLHFEREGSEWCWLYDWLKTMEFQKNHCRKVKEIWCLEAVPVGLKPYHSLYLGISLARNILHLEQEPHCHLLRLTRESLHFLLCQTGMDHPCPSKGCCEDHAHWYVYVRQWKI